MEIGFPDTVCVASCGKALDSPATGIVVVSRVPSLAALLSAPVAIVGKLNEAAPSCRVGDEHGNDLVALEGSCCMLPFVELAEAERTLAEETLVKIWLSCDSRVST